MKGRRGKIIAITRGREEAEEFVHMVSTEGGEAIALQTTTIVPSPASAAAMLVDSLVRKKHDYCAFLSAQSVRILFALGDRGEIMHVLAKTGVIAVGPQTEAALEEFGIKADFVPPDFSSKGLVSMLAEMKPAGKKIIIPRSAAANDYARRELVSLGMEVDEVVLYSVRTAEVTDEWRRFARLLQEGKVSAVVFTSPSNVSAFLEILAGLVGSNFKLDSAYAISIGPFTTAELTKRGIPCHEAAEHTVRGAFELAKSIAM